MFDSRVPVQGAQKSSHFSHGYNTFEDWLVRLGLISVIVWYVRKLQSTGGISFDINNDSTVDVNDAYAFVDTDGDAHLSVGEISWALAEGFLFYVFATAVVNLIKSFGPQRGKAHSA